LIRELKEEVGKLRGLIKAEGLEAKVAAYGELDALNCNNIHVPSSSMLDQLALPSSCSIIA
jgi:hypothetical protein